MKNPPKIVAIGDIHGNTCWKKIIEEQSDANIIIFIGDYFDSFDKECTSIMQINNFKEICDLKRENPSKYILLFGNHDYHYMKFALSMNETYSGFQNIRALQISRVITKALDEGLLQMGFGYNEFLFTHAGVSKTWFNNVISEFPDKDKISNTPNVLDICLVVNELFKYKPQLFKFTPGKNYDNGGDDITQTPIWIRPNSLEQDKIPNVTYVVGHTRTLDININNNPIQIDVLANKMNYLIIENNVVKTKISF